MSILISSTHPRWFAASSADLQALLSDHLRCERKAAENALSLVRRYPHRGASIGQLSRLAHEETSHVVQVGALIARRGWTPRTDTPNRYARALLAEVRGREPGRLLDALERKYDRQFKVVFDAIRALMKRPRKRPRRIIGFRPSA